MTVPSRSPRRIAELVAASGLRVTPQRTALLHLLVSEGGHLTADELHRLASVDLAGLSATSIYKSLHSLRDVGLVREVVVGAGAVRYDANLGEPHHHRVCRLCGRVDDVACAAESQAACLNMHDLDSFEVERVELVYHGTCAGCRTAADGARRPRVAEHLSAASPIADKPEAKEGSHA